MGSMRTNQNRKVKVIKKSIKSTICCIFCKYIFVMSMSVALLYSEMNSVLTSQNTCHTIGIKCVTMVTAADWATVH